jgi:beta-glucosidase-like glycosyl hydrolase
MAAGALIPGLVATGPAMADDPPATFVTQVGGAYDGLPLFDSDPAHLDAYLDVLMDYAGLEGALRWADGWRDDYTLTLGPNAGRTIPGAPQFAEHVHGVSGGNGTAFPAPIGLSQMWNKDLIAAVGQIISEEKLYTQDYSTATRSSFNAMISSALQDVRANPLSGRLEEGLGEDSQLASQLIEALSLGISGVDDPASEDGFWTKAILDTKHFTNYQAQWYRTVGSVDASQRHLMENASYPAMRAVSAGAMNAFMTSYGRTNGIPNNVSPLVQHIQSKAPYGMHQTNDHSSENQLATAGSYSNGFDNSYTPSDSDSAALFILSNTGGIAATWPNRYVLTDILAKVEAGTYGITADDVYEVAKSQVTQLVRVGLFNELDASGVPVDYPFNDLTADTADKASDATVPAHQQTALQAAQESIVLLKNQNGTLPLSTSDDVAVVGPLADARFPNTYANPTPAVADAGLTPFQGIDAVGANVLGGGAIDGRVVRLKSVATGEYVTHDLADPGNVLTATEPDPAAAPGFEIVDWGQEVVSIRSTLNDKFVGQPQECMQFPGMPPGMMYPPGCVVVPPGTPLNFGASIEVQFGTNSTTLPNTVGLQENSDGTVSIIASRLGGGGFGGGFETALYTSGRYLTVDPGTGALTTTETFGSAEGMAAANTAETKFELEVVQAAGSQAVALADSADYAIVVLGHPSRNSSGEGSDRSTLYLGPEQYELAHVVADAYPGKTIVVLSTSYPVIAEELQADPDIAAILAAPYGGQYDGLALGQIVFGQANPTGKLTQTWYADMSALPPISEYSIPEGRNQTVTMADLDPRITVDMTNGDPTQVRLTYQYTDAPVTYPFGHGLSYSRFSYDGLSVTPTSDGQYTATLRLSNTGGRDTLETVQLYAANPAWSYGEAAPEKKLVAFEKVAVNAGQTVTVTLTFDAANLALWNTNADDFRVEGGTYTFTAAPSSAAVGSTTTLWVLGDDWPTLDIATAPVNVFDKSFAAQDVTYREASKANTVEGLRADDLVHGYYTVMSKKAGAWTALSDVAFDGTEEKVTVTVASTNPSSSVSLRLDSPTGPLLGSVAFGSTGATAYDIPALNDPAGDIPVNEINYRDYDIPLASPVTGVHDLYVVFGAKDVRVRSLTAPQADDPPTTPPSETPPSETPPSQAPPSETPGGGDTGPKGSDQLPSTGADIMWPTLLAALLIGLGVAAWRLRVRGLRRL